MINSYAAKEDLCSQFLRILPVCTSDTFVASGAGAYRSIWESCVFKINIMTYIFISIFNSTMICQLKSPLVVVAELCHHSKCCTNSRSTLCFVSNKSFDRRKYYDNQKKISHHYCSITILVLRIILSYLEFIKAELWETPILLPSMVYHSPSMDTESLFC